MSLCRDHPQAGSRKGVLGWQRMVSCLKIQSTRNDGLLSIADRHHSSAVRLRSAITPLGLASGNIIQPETRGVAPLIIAPL